MVASEVLRDDKLQTLAAEYEASVDELLEEYGLDSVVPGICMNPGCDYSAEYEPDAREGWCEVCDTQSVASLLVLLGVI